MKSKPDKKEGRSGYLPGLEINHIMARFQPYACAVIVRDGDGVSVGPCWHHLDGGTTCPVHGKVKELSK